MSYPSSVDPDGISDFINVKNHPYAAAGDGIIDDTAAITAALSAANSAGGGTVYFPPGTYLTSNQTLYSKVYLVGAGISAATIKLKNGANTDLFSAQTSSINLSASLASGPDGTLYNFGLSNLTLDGNKANQSGGPSYPLRFYGYGYLLDNIVIKNGYSGGVLSDWNGTGINNNDGVESRWKNIKIHHCNGTGLQIGGSHDSQFVNVILFSNSGHGLHVAPNATGVQFNSLHSWGNMGTGVTSALIEAGGGLYENCVFESPSDTNAYHLILLGQNVIMRTCKCLSSGAYAGMKLGQDAGESPIPGQILQSSGVTTYSAADYGMLDFLFVGCTGTNGATKFDKIHNSVINAHFSQSSGNIYTGYLDPTNQYVFTVDSLTSDGSVAKGGQTRIVAESQNALTVCGTNYLDYFNIATHVNQRFEFPNGTLLQGYSDNYTTTKWYINKTNNGEFTLGNSSSLYSGSGAPSNGLGNNGDFYFRTDTPGITNQQLYIKSSGAWQSYPQIVKTGQANGGTLEWGVPTNERFFSVGTTTLNANQVRYSYFKVEYPVTLTAWQFEVTTGPASNANVRVGIYSADGTWQPSGAPLYDNAGVAVASGFTGIKSASSLSVALSPGRYLTAINMDVSMVMRGFQAGTPGIDNGLGANPFIQKVVNSQTYGAFPNPGTSWNATNTGTGGMQHSVVWQWTE